MVTLKTFFEKKYIWCSILLFSIGIVFIFKVYNDPIRDFGNYFYASKLVADGKFSPLIYEDINYFNQQIAGYGEKDFFENYSPVPPFSLIFYLPFVFMKAATAKFVFNLLGLILLCFSVFRLMKVYSINSFAALFVPIVFVIPVYLNIYQGQFYMVALSLLIEAFLLIRKGKWMLASLLFAVLISVKLFPLIFLIYFIVKREFKFVFSSLVLVVLLHLVLFIYVDVGTIVNYFTDVLPRLLQNDIIGVFHPTNQSFYSLLMNLFSPDGLSNRSVLIDFPYVVPVLEALIVAFVLAFYFNIEKRNELMFFSLTAMVVILIGRYNASYAMLMLMPLFIYLAERISNRIVLFTIFAIMTFAFWIPVGTMSENGDIIKFSRLILLSILFFILIYQLRIRFSLIYFSVFFIGIIAFRLITFRNDKADYFSIQNANGVLYDIEYRNDSLLLYSCFGEGSRIEKYYLPDKVEMQAASSGRFGPLNYKNPLDKKTFPGSNFKKGFMFNDSLFVFMSDRMQGIRMYKLQQVRIK